MNLSFAGCGFMGLYHVGVAACFRKYAPDLYLKRASGASAGAMAAAALLCDASLGDITNHVLQVALAARSRVLGPFSPSFNISEMLRKGLEKNLPEDAHLRVNGKLHVSVTRVHDGENIILTDFQTKEELIQALECSCFIPFFSGLLPPKFRGVRYMDGGLSDNLLVLDQNTITVSPFSGESDICPRDSTSARLIHIVFANTSIELSKNNLTRLTNIMFPPEPEMLSKICQQGFDDARCFLQLNDLICCVQCVPSSPNPIVRSDSSNSSTDPCQGCETQKQIVVTGGLPETVALLLENAITNTNGSLSNWVFQQRGMGLLSALSLPVFIATDVLYATGLKLVDHAPLVKESLVTIMTFLFSLLLDTLKKKVSSYTQVAYQLVASEFSNGGDQESHLYYDRTNRINFDFTLNLQTIPEIYDECSLKDWLETNHQVQMQYLACQ